MLPPLLGEICTTETVTAADGTTLPLTANVTFEQADRLNELVEALHPEVAIEIGCAHGISTLAIGAAMRGREHHVIDPFQSSYGGVGFANVRRAGLDTVCHEDFPERVVPDLPRAQFAFIDASHLFDLSVLDFVLVDKRLDVGGVIGFHDLWMDSLRKLLRYILTNRDYEVVDPRWKPPSRQMRMLRSMPRASRMLRPELLKSLPEMGMDDVMVFVRKTAEDSRHWTLHHDF